MSSKQVACSHEKELFSSSRRKKVIKKLIKYLEPHKEEFDAVVVSGYSMALIAPSIADALGKNIILVRKLSETNHSEYLVEGVRNQGCVFIDDLIASGGTFRFVYNQVKRLNSNIIGYILYDNWCNADWEVACIDPTIKWFGPEEVETYKVKIFKWFGPED
jgi:orotate phosphoribosyltransferase-like protein